MTTFIRGVFGKNGRYDPNHYLCRILKVINKISENEESKNWKWILKKLIMLIEKVTLSLLIMLINENSCPLW